MSSPMHDWFRAARVPALIVVFLVLSHVAWGAGSTPPPATVGPQTLVGFGGAAGGHEFFHQPGSSWKGDLTGIGAGESWSLVVVGIDATGVTGPADRFVYFNLQDADDGSHFKCVGVNFYLDATGCAGGTCLQAYQQWTSEGMSGHGLNPGVLTTDDFDLRFDFTKAAFGDGWTITPYFRLSGGSWTLFSDGPFVATVGGVDFGAGKLIVGFDGGADGTLSFDNFYLAGPPASAYVDDDWAALDEGDAVQFPGETDWSTFGVDAFGAVQDGIDAVVGSEVHVAAGTYVEQVHITDNDLELVGSGEGATTIQSPATLTDYFTTSGPNNNYPIVFVDGATGVAISDLTVDGDGRGNANYRFCGIAFWNSGGSVSDVTVTRVRDNPFSGGQHGVPVYAYNDAGGPYAIALADVTIDDFQKTGVALSGTGLTVDLDRVDVTGHGATAVTAQNGIQIGFGAGGTVTDCSVSDIAYTGGGWAASGMLFYQGTTVDVDGSCVLTDCMTSFLIQETQGSVTGASVTAAAVEDAEGVSVRDYGYAKARGDREPLEASPFDEGLSQGFRGAPTSISLDDLTLTGVHEASSYGVAAWALGDDVSVTVTGSDIEDWEIGVVAYESGSVVDLSATDNTIASNDLGFYSNAAATQDADLNWWGDASGPEDPVANPDGTGNGVDGDVDYSPWYGNTPGTVPMSWKTNGSIQEAINAASAGDRIDVNAGTYAERITINKTLELRGAQHGVDPTAPGARTNPANESTIDITGIGVTNPNVAVEIPSGVTGVTFSGFTVIGSPTSHYADESDIRCWDDNTTIEDNILAGYLGVLCKGADNQAIERNRGVVNKNGVVVQPNPGMNVSISDNNFTLGATPAGDESGIYITGCTNVAINGNTAAGFVNAKGIVGSNVDHITISGNTLIGNKDAISFWGTTTFITMSENVISNSLRYGISIKGQDITIENNQITDNGDVGVNIERHEIDTERVTLRYNNISGNTNYGVKEQNASEAVDARWNWWGDATGPNVSKRGTGDGVTGNVLYDPWIGKSGGENIVCDPDPQVLTVADPTNTVDVDYLGGGGGLVYGYSISVSWDPAKVTMNSITEGNLLSDQGNTWFFVNGSGSSRTVDCVLTGAQPGVSGPGTMFTISFTGAGYGTSPVDLTIIKVRDKDNLTLSGFYEDDGEVHVDITNPVVSNVHLANLTLAHTDDYAKDTDNLEMTADVSDDYGLSASDIKADLSALLDGGGAAVPAESYSLGVATWTAALANVDLTADGLKTVTVTATDGLGNSGTASDGIIADNTAPGSISGFNASPHHERVSMAWANPSGLDTYYYGVLVRYDGGGDYPEYATLGAYPADPAGGDGDAYDQIGVVTGGDHNIAARDIYYYTAFAYDWALNYGPAATSSEDRATNYWLGDVTDDLTPGAPYDGLVDANDFNELSAHYWEYSPSSPPVAPFNECDVGPTDTGSPFGIPEPDDYIDFEDLILFALNYNVVTPTGKAFPEVHLAGKTEAGVPTLVLKGDGPAEVGKEWSVSLCLGGKADLVKGVSVVLAHDASVLEYAAAVPSEALGSGVFFRGGSPEAGTVRIDLAVLGAGEVLHGTGELARLTFRVRAEGAPDLRFAEVKMRDAENRPLVSAVADLADGGHGSAPALRTRLSGAWPNPFNPVTKVSYELREPSRVVLQIYDAQGRLVRTLVDETRGAGLHEAVWDGRDGTGRSTGSGVYLLRMRAGEYQATSKLIMLR
ncbi:MAG: right-handed parallel beta-helix repeat-containing protein [Candidatus Eisenbacteria bacterium]